MTEVRKHPREMNEAELREEVERLRKQEAKLSAYLRELEAKYARVRE